MMAYAFTLWTCYVLKKEYEIIATMRLRFLASEERRPDQFTVRSKLISLDIISRINNQIAMPSLDTLQIAT